ncbi:hypothetical protein D7030_10140 [Flavobacteriaceae bacterium AU392]|nr:hypothetical protein D1817_06670 [Flavobacteriaceae bacterium]RKM83646.1 hypothetical protein D7030_10140 [Flavobacteriaceae bacterium AU392]
MMKKLIISLSIITVFVLLLFFFGVVWKSPAFYKTEKQFTLDIPIIDMSTYMDSIVNKHRRPYIYNIKSKKGGQVIVLGVNHTSDANDTQFDSIRYYWNEYKPTVALVEGRLGFFFKWLQDPIEEYGEGGLLSDLAKRDRIDLYTWEPSREDEIELLINKYSAKKLAMFYSLRPFFSIPKEVREKDPEKKLQKLINERTDYDHLRNTIVSWEEIDSIWKSDFPNIEWRNYSTGYGWPGYFHDIWNSSNLSRDEHMIKIILELIEKGETVIVTMGVSHAPRIENTLIHKINEF